ncbi:uncharacterized protein [Physcomitrium patens]|uniref:Uncharacterized protein n=1 Tax=Physcomitrium patens TaxID=3218 RepID=A0A2K1J3W1_PHYPA|nr:uncharacterized protein LOC112294829 [Physcomitrium patens]XP_024401485.1 uncharacterized protein LOC112294829 [Physcomitrium patens]XP_024401486.1 uncharacterized protein LOC112294829 [Physcomitrium patens]XP_024401487.1 uncharacterized protein LOC112294829 [Physcomitrium patens]XP_024401488.1 uncharacterized protein LOC112294829 [Physcomitrium patens]PNR36213.1 hypothetical protein PHYPA_022064 [Physcomitrium patens]|eukprot:XP_024401484.1 uncharacterized protein LOC112294829 [Physcomitrella patens]
MSSNCSCSCSSSNEDVSGETATERPMLLQGIGSIAVSLTFYILRKSRRLPGLVGPAIGAVEDIVSPCIQPLATRVGTESLYFLSLADEKLYELGQITTKKIPFLSGLIRKVKGVHSLIGQAGTVASSAYEQVSERGVIGAAADTWMKYEVTVKSKTADSLKYVNRVPLLNVFVPVIYTVGTSIASAISSWLSKHSEFQDVHLVFHEVHLLDDEKDLKTDPEVKHLYVVDSRAEVSSNMDTHNSSSEIGISTSSTPETSERSTHPEVVRKADLFEEVDEGKPSSGGSDGKGKLNVAPVIPASSPGEDSDDELTVLFDAGWSLGSISPPRKVLVESEDSKKWWWL